MAGRQRAYGIFGAVCFVAAALVAAFGAASNAGSQHPQSTKKTAAEVDPALPAVERVLRAELQGLSAAYVPVDRRQQLAAVLEQNPDSAAARWQSGFVRTGQRSGQGWRSFDETAPLATATDLLDKYRGRRREAASTSTGQIELADWCRRHKLPEQERAHLQAAMDRAPAADHTAILERLGNTQFGNVWLSREQIEQWQALNRRTEKALQRCGSRIEKLAERLDGSPRQQETAVAAISQLTEVDLIPVMEYTLCGRSEAGAAAAVQAFGKMDACEATWALAKQAVFSNWPRVREQATRQLKGRKFEDFVPPLIGLLATPVTKQVAPARLYYVEGTRVDHRGATGQFVLLSGYILARETNDQFQVAVMHQVDYRLTEALQGYFVRFRGGFHLEPESGVQNAASLNSRLAAARTTNDSLRNVADKERLIQATVDAVNERTDELNQRVVAVLAAVADRDPKPDPANWWQWWGDFTDTQLAESKGTVLVAEDAEYVGDPYLRIRRRSCFAAGTPVWTDSGPVPIERIQVGDRVLAQNIDSGELTYKAVLCTTVRPAKPLVSLQFGNESIDATGGHRFWATGEGWTKARDLRAKTLIRTVTGNSAVGSVESGPTAETYNLVVDAFHNYFVGRAGFLVQDLPLPQPTNVVVPGLSRTSTVSQAKK